MPYNIESDNVRIVRPNRWLGRALQYGVLLIPIILINLLSSSYADVLTICFLCFYLLYWHAIKTFITNHHRRGLKLMKEGQYQEAITEFQLSYDFLNSHQWIDKYRAIIFSSPGVMSLREAALCNIGAMCQLLKQNGKSQQYYEKVLQEFPHSELAKNNLKELLANK